MENRRATRIALKKEPRQARSTELVATILSAAAQVLSKEGAQRFTTARVAERAGVSVGSLYQYFPNKASILFRLQSDEWRQTSDLLRGILENPARPPLDRLRELTRTFVRSECDEAEIRVALNDAAPLYRDAPEAHEARASADNTISAFMKEVLPEAPDDMRKLAGDLVITTLSEVGRTFSETPRTSAEIDTFADMMADMFCAYLERLDSVTVVQNAAPPATAKRRR